MHADFRKAITINSLAVYERILKSKSLAPSRWTSSEFTPASVRHRVQALNSLISLAKKETSSHVGMANTSLYGELSEDNGCDPRHNALKAEMANVQHVGTPFDSLFLQGKLPARHSIRPQCSRIYKGSCFASGSPAPQSFSIPAAFSSWLRVDHQLEPPEL
ncbi:unnamed protein product [Cyclocybe aegerita]|uniref:Uncharacterized protein n=1 Tax=Cyclocybe aegerita TaxID=1973307 RepID=A0A8S0XZK5_CYCAE|nr:unnamed protein product [Cyclocybe aegerita]